MTRVAEARVERRSPVNSTYAGLPDSVRESVAALTRQVRDLLKPGTKLELAAVERTLGASFAELGQAVMRQVLAQLDPGGDDVVVDGQRHWQAVRATREYMSAFGRVAVERGVYRAARNGPTVCPMELRAGIVEGFWTPHAAKLAALCISDMTPKRAESFFKELGMMGPSRSSLDRLPKALNEHWERNRASYEERIRADEQIPSEAVTVAVSLDGVLVPTRGTDKAEKKAEMRRQGRLDKGPAGYREVGCGALSFYDAEGNRLATRRMARMPEANKLTLKEQLRGELEHVRRQRPELVVVAVADGAADNWEFLSALRPDHQVVDFFHAVEHLKLAVDVSMGGSGTVPTRAKFERLRKTLRHHPSGADKVMAALKSLRPRRRGDPRDYRTGVTYFHKHRERMNYAALQAANLPIGSGVIEGTCKSLASDRLKRAGMRWDRRGGQAILNLRSWAQSDRFDAAWRLLQAHYSVQITAAA
jgi:hypothetical protein